MKNLWPLPAILVLFFSNSVTSFDSPIFGAEFSGGSFQGFLDISQGLRQWVNPSNTSQNSAIDANGELHDNYS